MSYWSPPSNWYWFVNDSSPGSQVWKSSVGAFVAYSDSDYVAFLAAGNTPTTIDTLANLLIVIDSFNQSLVRPGYESISISGGNYALTVVLNNLIPKTINIQSIDTTGRALVLPQENLCGSLALGASFIISNNDVNSNTLLIYLADGSTEISAIPVGGIVLIVPISNSSTNGTWEDFYLPSVPLIPPIPVAQGGTGQVSLVAHGVLVGEGVAQVGHVTPGGAGALLIGQSGADPSFNAMSGDATIANTGAITVSKINGQGSSPASFSPTDQSGASLAFTSVNVQYCQIANIVFVYGTLTYPVTVDTSNATISLPVAVPNQTYAQASFHGGSANNTYLRPVPNSSTMIVTNGAGVNVQNGVVSATTFHFMVQYPAT